MPYHLKNPYTKFIPMDLCWVKGTKELVLITEVNCNTSQTEDKHQWSFAAEPLTPGNNKCAWYSMDELVLIKNLFDVIAKNLRHPMGNKTYNFSVSGSARRPDDNLYLKENVE